MLGRKVALKPLQAVMPVLRVDSLNCVRAGVIYLAGGSGWLEENTEIFTDFYLQCGD